MAIDFKKALDMVKERGLFQGITRFKYDGEGYDLNESLQLVEAIGKQRNPKFVIDDENRFTYENIIKWLHCDHTMKAIHPDTKEDVPGDMRRGIYVAGNTGSGKSWCLEVMLAYAYLFRFKIKYGGDDAHIWWQIARADEIVARFVETTSIDEYKKAKLLCIQDFGAEQLEAVAMGNRMNVLRTLLEYRGDRSNCLTMITSNYSLKNPTLTESYGERVTSRLMEMCNYFEIKGKDRRKL